MSIGPYGIPEASPDQTNLTLWYWSMVIAEGPLEISLSNLSSCHLEIRQKPHNMMLSVQRNPIW